MDVNAADHDGEADDIDVTELYAEGDNEGVLAAVEAEWDTTDTADRPFAAAMAAKAAARLGRSSVGLEWLTRATGVELDPLDHRLVADAYAMLGQLDEAGRHARAASAASPGPDDRADLADGFEVVVAARLGTDLATLAPLAAERLVESDARDWLPDRFAADHLFGDDALDETLRVAEWAQGQGRTWTDEPDVWLAAAGSAIRLERPAVAVRALEGRFEGWPGAEGQVGALLLGQAKAGLGDRAGALDAFTRAAAIEGQRQDEAERNRALFACGESDHACQFAVLADWWAAKGDTLDAAERVSLGIPLLQLATTEPERARRAIELIGPVALTDPLSPWLELNRAYVAHDDACHGEALAHLDRLDTGSDLTLHHNSLLLRARVALADGRPDEAFDALTAARALRAAGGPLAGKVAATLPIDLHVLSVAKRWDALADVATSLVASSAPDEARLGWRGLVAAHIGRGDLAAAVATARNVVEYESEADVDLAARLVVADRCLAEDRIDDAAAVLGDDIAGASEPLRRRRWIVCLTIADRRGDLDASIAVLRAGAALDPDMKALLRLYLALFRSGDPGSPSLDELVDPPDDSRPIELLVSATARSSLSLGEVDELLERAAALDPSVAGWPLHRIAAAGSAAERGDEAAVRSLLAGLGPALENQLLALAASHAADAGTRDGRMRQLAFLDAVTVDARPGVELDRMMLATAHARRALVLLQLDDQDGAALAVSSARDAAAAGVPAIVKLQPDFAAALVAQQSGAWNTAAEHLAAIDLDPLPARLANPVREVAALVERSRGDLESARRYLLAATEHDANRSSLLQLGEVELALQDPTGAREVLQRALDQETDEALVDVLVALSHAERLLHHDTTAIERARDALAVDAGDPSAYLALGAALASAERWDAALKSFERGLRVKSGRRLRQQLWCNRLVLLSRLDRHEQVLAETAGAPSLDDEYRALVAQCHAAALDRLGRRGEAIDVLRKATDNPHLASSMRRVVAQTDDERARRGSWLGFWFDARVGRRRRALGAGLLAAAVVAAVLVSLNPERVDWLRWRATGPEAGVVLVLLAVLFLVPLATNLKVGGVEIAMPTPPEPMLDSIDAVDVTRVLHQVAARVFDVRAANVVGASPIERDASGPT